MIDSPAVRLSRGLPRPSAWLAILIATPFLAAFYLALPTDNASRTIAYPVYGIAAMIAILVGVRRRRPSRLRSWRLIAVGLAFLSVGDLTWSALALVTPEVPYPSLADVGYLVGYGAVVLGTAGLIRGRTAEGDRAPLIDSAILATGAASLFWIAIIQPSVAGVVDPVTLLVSVSYPVMDLLLLGLGLHLLLASAALPATLRFVLAATGLYLVADVIYAMAVLEGSYVDGHPVDALWIVGILLWAVAAHHPSAAQVVPNVSRADARLGRARLGLLAGAAMLAPAILVLKAQTATAETIVGLVAGWTVLFALVLVRLATTVDELGISLHLRRRLQDDLTFQAHHDALTRLANRTLFERRLATAMEQRPARTALVFIDLDDFKTINDTLGHGTGDELLTALAGRIKRELRGSDLAARLGGDEFAILIEDCGDEATARSVAERVLAGLRAPVSLPERQLMVRASAGVAMGSPEATAESLMRDADVAMYQAKARGKGQVELYAAAMHGEVVRSYQLRTELAQAISAGDFVLQYQPAIDLASGAIVGAEALVRWQHPERGLVLPGDFIPLAESSGLIVELGRWILADACRTAAAWPVGLSGRAPAVSVNLAPSQLIHPALVDDVVAILAETGLAPDRLVLEVTEGALLDREAARAVLERLRDVGVLLALDDFGTGYSAMGHLADLPFHILKIDRSFVGSLGSGRRVEALLDGIVGLSRALDMVTVAEGIETTRQLDGLRSRGCEIGQGYLFARPISAAAFTVLLAEPERAGSADRRSILASLRSRAAESGSPAA